MTTDGNVLEMTMESLIDRHHERQMELDTPAAPHPVPTAAGDHPLKDTTEPEGAEPATPAAASTTTPTSDTIPSIRASHPPISRK